MQKHLTFAKIAPFLIFLFFFGYTLIIRLSIGTFLTSDDPFFHARMSHSLWHGEEVTMPRLSTQHDHTSNLYFLYHAAMSPFVGHCETSDFKCIITGSQIFHSLIVGLFAVFSYLVFQRVLRRGKVKNSEILALLLVVLMVLVSRQYLHRFLMERPIIWSLGFTAVYIYALVRKKDYWIFFIPLAYVFSYSVTFMILIPAFVYAFSGIFAGKQEFRYGLRTLGLTLGGLAAGIILRPDSYNYLLNAYGSHFLSIYQSLTSHNSVSVPGEFKPVIGELIYSYNIWYWIFLFLFVYLLVKAFRTERAHAERRNLIFLNGATLFFTLLFPIFFRAIDYLLFIGFFSLAYNIAHYSSLRDDRSLLNMFLGKGKYLIAISILAVLSLSFVLVRPIKNVTSDEYLHKYFNMEYTDITEAIRKDYTPGELVFTPGFGVYAKLIFYDPGITYPMGMDSSFTRLYDEQVFWKIQHMIRGENICGTHMCAEDEGTYEFLREIETKYVLVDDEVTTTLPFAQTLASDKRFELVYTHSVNTNLHLYKVN